MGCFRARSSALRAAIASALLVAATAAAAQQAAVTAPKAQPEVPYVLRLTAIAAPGSVTLTWKDSPDVVGTCLVFRAAAEITASTLSTASLAGRVPSGTQTFTDAPDTAGPWFYAVIMEDSSGVRYPLAVPYRNITTVAVTPLAPVTVAPVAPAAAAPTAAAPSAATPTAAAPAAAAPAAETPATPAPSTGPADAVAAAPTPAPAAAAPTQAPAPEPARITGISAALSSAGDSISVTFSSTSTSRDLLLFSSTTPLVSSEDLLKASSTAPLDQGTTKYAVAALPGTSYWFAVLDAGLYKVGQAPLIQGQNATADPVRVPAAQGLSAAASAARRAQPLPSLDPNISIQTGALLGDVTSVGLPTRKAIAPATSQAVNWLVTAAGSAPAAARQPEVLAGDSEPATGELGQLLSIVQGPFRANDMSAVQVRLGDFLSLPRSAVVEAHARFYLGQSYWFQGRTRDALLEFLSASDTYYLATQPWIDAALDALQAEGSAGNTAGQ